MSYILDFNVYIVMGAIHWIIPQWDNYPLQMLSMTSTEHFKLTLTASE